MFTCFTVVWLTAAALMALMGLVIGHGARNTRRDRAKVKRLEADGQPVPEKVRESASVFDGKDVDVFIGGGRIAVWTGSIMVAVWAVARYAL